MWWLTFVCILHLVVEMAITPAVLMFPFLWSQWLHWTQGSVQRPILLRIFSPTVMDLTLVDLPGLTKAGDQTGIFGIWKLWESVKLDNMFCWTLSSSYRWHGGTTWNYMKPFQKWNLFNLFSVWRDIITTTESPISIPSSFTCQVPTADQPKDMPQKIRRPGRHRGLFLLGG